MTRSNLQNPAQRIELSERQEEVVRLIEKGLTNGEIADRLDLSVDGVKWHVREIFGKLGVDSREEAVARWREERSVSRRARNWAGAALGSMSLKWAGGAVLAGGAGVAGIAAMASAFSAEEPPADEPLVMAAPTATPTPTPPPDIATADGLTMTVHRIQADDTKTVIDILLEGRPELGRFGNPATQGFPKLTDDKGIQYNPRSGGGEEGRTRFLRITFDPVPETAKYLMIEIDTAFFVAPAFEVPEGQRPPDPSATVQGPWRIRIDEIPRDPTSRVVVDARPREFGGAAIVLDEVLQTADSTVVRGHVETLPGSSATRNIAPYATLVTADGTDLVMITGSWGSGPKEDQMEWVFPVVSGSVTLRLQESGPHVLALSPEDIEANVVAQGLTGVMADHFREAKERSRAHAAVAWANADIQPPAEWDLVLP